MLKFMFCIVLLVAGVENARTPTDSDHSILVVGSSLPGNTTTSNTKLVSGALNTLGENFLTTFSTHSKDLHGLHGHDLDILSNPIFRTTSNGGDQARTALAIGLKALKLKKGIEIIIGAMCLQMLLRMHNYSPRPMGIILRAGGILAQAITRIVLQSTSLFVRVSSLVNLLSVIINLIT